MFCLFVCLYFCWQLLISENTLIQVVKLKKKKKEKNKRKKFLPELGSSAYEAGYQSTWPLAVIDIFHVNFSTYFFLRDQLPINVKMLVFSLAKCVRNAVKTMVVDRKNQKALTFLRTLVRSYGINLVSTFLHIAVRSHLLY